MGWGEQKELHTGTCAEIEAAHQALDDADIPGGVLAKRVKALVERYLSAKKSLAVLRRETG